MLKIKAFELETISFESIGKMVTTSRPFDNYSRGGSKNPRKSREFSRRDVEWEVSLLLTLVGDAS